MTDVERLQAIYDREINFEIVAFFGFGVGVVLGDAINGYKSGVNIFDSFEQAISWLEQQGISND